MFWKKRFLAVSAISFVYRNDNRRSLFEQIIAVA